MSQMLQFEGPVLPDVLATIEGEHGTNAKIVAAKKSRRGGVAGFFSREWFEVTVELTNGVQQQFEVTPITADIQLDTSVSVLDVVEKINHEEAEADTRLLQAAQIEQQHHTKKNATTQTFAEVLQSVREMPEETLDVVDTPFIKVGPQTNEAIITPEEITSSFVPVQNDIQVISQTTTTRPPAPLTTTPLEVVPGMTSSEVIELLVKRGVPRVMLSEITEATHDLRTGIELAMRAVPSISDAELRATHLIAVIGVGKEAQKFSRFLARKLQVNFKYMADVKNEPSRLGEKVITNIEEAMIARRAWSRRRTTTIVSVPASTDSCVFAENILTAMEADYTIVVADARQKVEDVEAMIENIGGADAVAISNISRTSTPAAILQVGVPVGFIDEHVATSALWAASLVEDIH